MKPVITPEIKEVMHAIHFRPAISIIMPFEPKMDPKTELAHALKLLVDKTELELRNNYPNEICDLMLHKLNNIVKQINFNTHKKSIAIFVSPVFEKVLYLDIAVEEKLIIDESFEIRDLVYCKKELHKYLVLLLSANESRIFLGNSDIFVRILTATPETVYAFENDVPQRVANFSDMQEHKQIITEKFLKHVDKGLDIILKSYNLPLFIAGAEKILGHFKKITKHGGAIVEAIHGSYDDASPEELKTIVKPYVADWKKVKQKDLINLLEEAADKKKLSIGIHDVWRQAVHHKGRLLVVEKNYMYAAQHGSSDDTIYKPTEPFNTFSYIKDAVDDVIEKVLESGGDVEFVDAPLLQQYYHIALIQYYS
ncbi:MAG: hypothetical protein K2X48_00560 [Chitinophagaceae bacterium]|nr:hypothetical protein [Chitinophagaceae bacterium]